MSDFKPIFNGNANPTSIEELSKSFLKTNIDKNRFIVHFNEFPSRKVREYLTVNKYLYSPIRGLYIIKDNKIPNKMVLEQNYFQILSELGWIIWWEIALNYHVWDNKKINEIIIYTQDKNWKVRLGDSDYCIIYKRSTSFKDVDRVDILWSKFFIETKLSFIINNFNEYSDNDNFKVLLDSTKINFSELWDLIKKWINQSNLSRLAFYYKQNDNIRNFSIIKNELAKSWKSLQYASKNEEKNDISVDFPKEDIKYEENTKLLRFERLFKKMDRDCEDYFKTVDLVFKKKNLKDILLNIDNNIIYDTYHSLTIENYKVSMKDIGILSNEVDDNEEYKSIKEKLTIKWYLHTFNHIKESIGYDFWHGIDIDHKFIQKLNILLFEEFGKNKGFKIPYEYRKNQVQITETSYFPPDYVDVDGYMNKYLEYINSIKIKTTEDVIKKAILTHFLFVYIHPFGDWNWRIARFLMNYILCTNWIDWITVSSNNKDEYINSLRQASEKEDIKAFCEFIIKDKF